MKQNISISEYIYELPEDRIAKFPVEPRDASKLLVYNGGEIYDEKFKDLASFIPNNSLLVYNNTRVIHARLLFYKATGAKIEIFCLEPHSPSDHQLSFSSKNKVLWKCMVGNLKKWKSENLSQTIKMGGIEVCFEATLVKRTDKLQTIAFTWDGDFTFSEIIVSCGKIPIPPYLHRDSEEKDKKIYQTIYAKHEGSVAAPTAGLHFTDRVFENLQRKNVQLEEVTLHVGAGTFQPVKTDDVAAHEMHSEWITVNKSSIQVLLRQLGNITAVGTTTVRTLESLYWVGVLLKSNPNQAAESIKVDQWLPYNESNNMDVSESLGAIISYLDTHELDRIHFFTQIIIVPGYSFKMVQRIITNFHQPSSTLLLLVSAFMNGDWKRLYDHALNNDYRFLSYGDASLLIN